MQQEQRRYRGDIIRYAEGFVCQDMTATKDWQGKSELLDQLENLEDAAKRIVYTGRRECPFCGADTENAEYQLRGWRWSSQYYHFIRDHNVKPSNEFIAMVGE